jgi:predicted transcriptional regulator
MTILRRLNEGIDHVDDLPVDQFIQIISTLKDMRLSEKLDGSNLWAGVDDQGKVFISREGKRNNAKRMYAPEDWAKVGNNNQFIAATAAIINQQAIFTQCLKPGQMVELEVLYGNQPNTVVYNNAFNLIAVLRGVEDTPLGVATSLAAALKDKTADVSVNLVSSDDGENLKMVLTDAKFQFITPKTFDAKKLEHGKLNAEVKKLQDFAAKKSTIAGYTNAELAAVNLNKVPKEERDAAKSARQELLDTFQSDFIQPIKALLLDTFIGGSRDGAEGVVISNPNDGSQLKLVDKEKFTQRNVEVQQERANLQGAVMTTDQNADLAARGGLMGELKIMLAELLGNRNMARGAELNKVLASLKAQDVPAAVQKLADQLQVDDYLAIRNKAIALTSATQDKVAAALKEFKGQVQADTTGKKLGQDNVKRTLVTYAEVNNRLKSLVAKLKGAEDMRGMVNAIYGPAITTYFEKRIEAQQANEALTENKGEQDMINLKNLTPFIVINCYLATLFMTIICIKEQDKLAMRKIADRSNFRLKDFSHNMSPLNFWGYIFWRASKADVKKTLGKETSAKLHTITKNIPVIWWRTMHQQLAQHSQLKLDVPTTQRMFKLILEYSGMRTARVNRLINGVLSWDDQDFDQKVELLNDMYLYGQQFLPTSYLYKRVRIIQSNMLLNANGVNDMVVTEGRLLKRLIGLTEDGEGDGMAGAEPSGQPAGMTATTDIAPLAMPLGTTVHVVKRKRNPNIKRLKFKYKDPTQNETPKND